MRPAAAAGLILGVLAGCAGCGSSAPMATAPAPKDPQVTQATTPATQPAAHKRLNPGRPRTGEHWGAALLRDTAVRRLPLTRSHVIARIPRRTRFDSRMVLAVVRQRGAWLGVVASELGNGRVGWVRADRIKLLRETWAIDVDLSKRQAVLTHKGKRYFPFAVAVGKPGTPTPTGRFGVTDRLRPGSPGSPYGCCVLALSGHQPNIEQDWPSSDDRLAIHGTDNPASVGTAASHGCLRADAAAMRVLMSRVPLGTPITIHA